MSNLQTVTALKTQKNHNRVNIFLENKFAFGLDLDTIYKFKIKVGLQLTQKQINNILNEGEYQQNLEKTIKLISLRPRSEHEINQWFKRKRIGTILSEKILNHLKKTNFINDKNFTNWWIEQRTTYKPRGKKLLSQELFQKGINKTLIEQELSKLHEQTQNIKKLILKKSKSLNRYSNLQKKTKLTAFLLRKGYQYAEIKPVIDELINKE